MSRLQKLFLQKNRNVLNMYCTAGFPKLESTLQIIEALEQNGADIIELGIPYSDPLADGPTIQESGLIAIKNGMTIHVLFNQLKQLKNRASSKTAIILMGYMNPVLQFGFERFCELAAEVGIDGLILPDLPEYEFENNYSAIFKKYDLDFIFLVTPETSEARVKKLDALSSGFIYAVSSSSVTGSDKEFSSVETYLQRLQSYQLQNPILVGFGIKDNATFTAACAYANGAIIGTAYIKALQDSKDINETTNQFIASIIN